jgi:hypothetical protein
MAGQVLKASSDMQWHITQYRDEKLVDHKIYPDYEPGRIALEYVQKRALGVAVLCRPSQCACRGRDWT